MRFFRFFLLRLCFLKMLMVLVLLSAGSALAQDEGGAGKGRGNLSPVALSVFSEKRPPSVLQKLAEKGDGEASLLLGYMYRLGHKVKKDPVQAVKWFRLASGKGNAEAQLQMAVMYAAGEGVSRDYAAMISWLQQSAGNGYGLAQYQLGLLYAKGITVDQDLAMARMWLGFAAEKEDETGRSAQKVLEGLRVEMKAAGLDYLSMPLWLDMAERYGRAIALFQENAGKGDARSQYLLGLVFGWLATQDKAGGQDVFYGEALRWLKSAAEQGYAPAVYRLALFYAEGRGVPANAGLALSWMEKAAHGGFAPGQFLLAEWGGSDVAAKNPEMALRWLDEAARQGYWYAAESIAQNDVVVKAPRNRNAPVKGWDARDQYLQAMAYRKGEGLGVDPEQAVAWLTMAAAQSFPLAERELGLAYLNGTGVAVDYAEAFRLLLPLAEQGDAAARFAVAGMYAEGKGVGKDEALAFFYSESAAKQGLYEAQLMTAAWYRDGRGVAKNPGKAVEWLEAACIRSTGCIEVILSVMQRAAG